MIEQISKEHRRWLRIAIVGAVAALAYYFLEARLKEWLKA